MATKKEASAKSGGTGRDAGQSGGGRGAGSLPGSEQPGRTIEKPGEPGLEKEPKRDKAVGPGGQRLTSSVKNSSDEARSPQRSADVEGVDKPDGINQIDPSGETRAEDTKLL
jgi:hypothetical protein